MMILNYKEIASTTLRKNAIDILVAGINSTTPKNAMPKHIKFYKGIFKVFKDEFDISKGKVYVLGFGKASAEMAQVLESIIPQKLITAGIVNCSVSTIKTKKIVINKASHPVPNENGVKGVKKMMELIKKVAKEDTVICLISGGGSSMLPDPADGITLNDLKKMTQLMLRSGVEIYELNNLRKHISKLKGGNLARILQPARVISLILTDVVNVNDITASGPTSPDNSTFQQSYDVLKKYNLLKKMPKSIVEYIKRGLRGKVPESVKPNDPFLKNVHNYIFADYKIALEAMRKKAVELGFDTEVLQNHIEGKVNKIAKKIGKLLRQRRSQHKNSFALIYSSENSVFVRGNGKGGRNQECIGYMIREISGLKNCVVASLDSDGIDFIYGVGGAITDNKTFSKAKKKNIDINKFLKDNNSFELHKKLGSLILMHPTNTNVGDLNIYLQE